MTFCIMCEKVYIPDLKEFYICGMCLNKLQGVIK